MIKLTIRKDVGGYDVIEIEHDEAGDKKPSHAMILALAFRHAITTDPAAFLPCIELWAEANGERFVPADDIVRDDDGNALLSQ